MNSREWCRKRYLKYLIDKIKKGKFYMEEIDLNDIYRPHSSARREYQSPYDTAGYNWGYMTSGDFGAGNEEAP